MVLFRAVAERLDTTQRATNYIWDQTGNTVIPISNNTTQVTVINDDTLQHSYWIDRYNTANQYQANVNHVTIPAGGSWVQTWQQNDLNWAGLGVNGDSLNLGEHIIHADLPRLSTVPCAYGTQLAPPGTFVYYLTPGLIDTWLAADGLPWLAPLFTAMWFTTFNAQDLCSTGPPPMPVIDLTTLEAGVSTVNQVLAAIAWPNLCQCKPGSPTPTPYPPPSATEPPGWPTSPTFGCDPAAICTTLVAMQQQLAAIQQTLGSDLELTTLLQRYSLPFAYIKGAVHSNLPQTGSFQVNRLIGLEITVAYTGPPQKQLEGNPPYLWNQGWVSVSDGNGFIDEKRLHSDRIVWLPKIMADVNVVGWWAYPGSVLTITELEAEP